MDIKKFLKIADKLDKQGSYKTSDKIFRLVQAEIDDDLSKPPFDMGDVPTERITKFDDLTGRFKRGEISESEFISLFQEMMASEASTPGDIDNFQSTLSRDGVQTFGDDRDFLEAVTEFSDDISVNWIDDIQNDAVNFFRDNGVEVTDSSEAGDKLLDLAQGNPINNLTINDAIRAITPSQNFFDYFDEYLRARIPEMIEMIEETASRSPYNKDIQVFSQEISTMLDEKNVNFTNVNEVLETILATILFRKVR